MTWKEEVRERLVQAVADFNKAGKTTDQIADEQEKAEYARRRRDFAKAAAAGASLSALPSWALALVPSVKITRIRIGLPYRMRVVRSGIPGTLLAPVHRPEGVPPPPDNENNYDAEVIEIGGRFWYRVRATTIEITAHDANRVIGNPHLYYVTRALSLHYRILWKEAHGNDYG